MTHKEKIQWMAVWACKNHCALDLEGECGLGRECVGIVSPENGCFPDYEWYDNDGNRLDDNGDIWTPLNAYHKHECVAVLGRGKTAEEHLYNWLTWFDENNFTVEVVDRELDHDKLDKTGILWKIFTGEHKHARMVKRKQNG